MKLAYDKDAQMVMRLGNAMVRAIAEHGTPNSFAFSELVGRHDAMHAGRAVRKMWDAFTMNLMSRLPDVVVSLSGGRLHADPR